MSDPQTTVERDTNATVRLNVSSIAQALVVSLLLGATGFWGVQFSELRAQIAEANRAAADQAMKMVVVIERQNEGMKRSDGFQARLDAFEARLNAERKL